MSELSLQEQRFAMASLTSTHHIGCIVLNGLECNCCLTCLLDCIGVGLWALHAYMYELVPVPPQEKAQHFVNLDSCHLLSELSLQEQRFARVGLTSDLHVGCIVLNGFKCNRCLICLFDCIETGPGPLRACICECFLVPPQERTQRFVDLDACHLLSELSQQAPRFLTTLNGRCIVVRMA